MTPESIQKFWPLSGVVTNVLRSFDYRLTLGVDAKEGRYVCKTTEGQFSDAEFRVRTSIFDFLGSRGFAHVPKRLKTRTGEDFVTLGNARTLVIERIPGSPLEQEPEDCAALGEVIGALNAISDYPHPALISVDAIRPDFPGIAEGLPASIRDPYMALAGSLPDIDALPRSLIHSEAGLSHAIRKPDGTLVLIDWDEAGTGATVLDPGFLLINQFVSEDLAFDAASATAFYRSYCARRPLARNERDLLFDASLFHALRYVIWGDVEKRWRRIAWAVENRRSLMSVVPAATI